MFAFYLKASKHPKYTVAQINNYPTTTSAVQVFATLVYAYISDGPLKGARWPVMLFADVSFPRSHLAMELLTLEKAFGTVIWISLAIWNISEGWRWACYILMGQGLAVVPLTLTYALICTFGNLLS